MRKMDILKTLIADSNWLTVDRAQYMIVYYYLSAAITGSQSVDDKIYEFIVYFLLVYSFSKCLHMSQQ